MRKVLFFSISLLLLSLFIIMFKSEKESTFDMQIKGESFIEGLKISHKINGKTLWLLTAKRADIMENGEKAYLSGIEMNIEEKNMTIYADRGNYDMTSKNIVIDGPLKAKTPTYSLTTENAEIDTAAGTMKTNEHVKIEGKNFNLQGKGMKIDNDEQKVRITNDVKATFNN